VTRLRDAFINLAVSAVTFLVIVAAFEGGARVFEKRRPPPPVADYIWDWSEKMEGGEFYTIRSEGTGWPPWEEINGDGVRDRTHSLEPPPGGRRVVMLGDSVTLGDHIRAAEAYPQVLEAGLSAAGRPVQVMNVALWGWSTRQERIAYERIVRKYKPDAVILGVCLNDIPELQNNLARPPAWLAGLYQRSALVRRIVDPQGREIQSVELLFTNGESKRVREAMARFFDEVKELRRLVEADGASFAVIVFPFRFQVEKDAPPPSVQEEIATFCTRSNLRCLDLLPRLRPLGESAFVDYDHLSPAGARVVAAAVETSALLPEVRTYFEILEEATGSRDPEPLRLVAALTSARADVRTAAAWALGQKGIAGRGGPALARAMRDPEASVRLEAAGALRLVGSGARKAAVDALFAALRDSSEQVRWAAARALFELNLRPPADVKPLAAALESEDVYVRGFAAFTLGEMGADAKAAVPALAAALRHEDGYGRGGASNALAKIGEAAVAAVPALVEGLADPDGDRRWKAARTLGRIGPGAQAAVPALVTALRDPHERVRANAARALGRIAPVEARDALRQAASDPVADVRKEAAEALQHGG
jgi:HEAT repeat protein/lysophospholipase L1-like esterase